MTSGSGILAGDAMRILITGVSTRALAHSAKAAGYDFLTLDYFGDYDQKSWCENYSLKRDFDLPFGPSRLYEASHTLTYDAVVYTASLENHPEIVARWVGNGGRTARPRLLGNPAPVLARVRHWPALSAFLQRCEVPGPCTVPAGQLPPQGAGRRWLRKPIRSGGGHDVTFWPADRPVGRGFWLQEYVPGRVCSAAFLANGREAVLLGLTEQLVGRGEFGATGFTYCGNLFPLPQGEDGAGASLAAQVRGWSAPWPANSGWWASTGWILCSTLAGSGRSRSIRVYSASMELIERASGLSMFDWQVRSTLHGELPDAADLPATRQSPETGAGAVVPGAGDSYAKAILYAERNCRAPDTRDWPARGVCDVPFPGEQIRQGEPVCTMIASGPAAGACYARLSGLAEELKGELYA